MKKRRKRLYVGTFLAAGLNKALMLGLYAYQMNYDPRKQTNASPTPQKTVAIDVRDAG